MGNKLSDSKQKPITKSFDFDKYLIINNDIETFYGSQNTANTFFGIITYKNKNFYHGQWKLIKDKIVLEGLNGKMTFNDGTVYTGEWVNGKYDGYGEMTLYTGASYSGYWKNGKRHGRGKMLYEDGTIIDDVWENGVRIQHAKDHYHDYNP